MKSFLKAASLIALLSASGGAALAQSGPGAIDGRWDAVLSHDGIAVPFRLDIQGSGPTLKGVFYDGFAPYDGTTSASFQDGRLTLNIAHYLTTIDASLNDGKLSGTAATAGRGPAGEYVFQATRHGDQAVAVHAPSIEGSWVIPLDAPSSKGEKAFRFVVQQKGAEVAAAILRIDGDTGSYSGSFQDGKWVLSHFDGGRPGVIVVTPKPDGTLEIAQHVDHPGAANAAVDGGRPPVLVAYRSDAATSLPKPDDFLTHTSVRDPDAIFKFAFPDIDGGVVTNEDPRFKGKVVLAVVSGTWCPNCHDEAQYLVQLDKKYRSKGLAIVDLDFEEPDQQGTLERARLQQAIWREVHHAARRPAVRDARKGAAVEQSRHLARHHLHRPRRQGESGACRFCLACDRRIQRPAQEGIHGAHRAASGGKSTVGYGDGDTGFAEAGRLKMIN